MTRSPDPDPAAAAAITVVVVRTGGIAGLRREWRAVPPPEERERWIALIDDCPWEAATGDGRGADRFSWDVRARCADDERDATLADEEVDGPWRALIDEVRATAAPPRAPSPRRAASPGGV
ncbi:protealysin inhibitor emfourin [Microbacterium sp. BWT-B31]|uniref:protealysin inhibitor emfourin n=1 Tax=Microbacterium sp. BWT-B31 TaxID=3232072 RepID=UPI003528E68E